MNAAMERIVDANINRVTEGLRVAEDVCRYAWNNRGLCTRIRDIRHRACRIVERKLYIRSRDVAADILAPGLGCRGVGTSREAKHLAQANLKRAQEGLRVLEEIFATENEDTARGFEELRYAVYLVEQEVLSRGGRLLGKGLYVILNAESPQFEHLARAASSTHGVCAVQLRCKTLSDRLFLQKARMLGEIVSESPALFIVNDRVDVAFASGADGVHLGQDDLDPALARKVLGPEALVGVSTHNATQVASACSQGVDYIGFGPVFDPFSKENHEPVCGIHALREAVRLSGVPVVAIGGICPERLPGLRAAGCHAIAALGAIERAGDPQDEIRRLATLFLEGA